MNITETLSVERGADSCAAPCSAVLEVMLRIAKEVGATSVTIADRESEVPYEPPQMAAYRRECAARNSRLTRCPECAGIGHVHAGKDKDCIVEKECRACRGTGVRRVRQPNIPDQRQSPKLSP